MAARETDRRLLDRGLREGQTSAEEIAKSVLEQADCSDDIEPPSEEQIEALVESLVSEKRVRDERIERARHERPAVVRPVHAAMPLDDEL